MKIVCWRIVVRLKAWGNRREWMIKREVIGRGWISVVRQGCLGDLQPGSCEVMPFTETGNQSAENHKKWSRLRWWGRRRIWFGRTFEETQGEVLTRLLERAFW